MARLELDGTLIHVNRLALEVPGFEREQVFKRLFWDCGWWNRAPEVQEWVKDAVRQAASGVPFRGDSRYFWADGSEHIVDFACIPIRDAGGKVIVLVATGMDITERVHAEDHRRALEEQRLRSDALAVLDRAKTEFFSNVSHEFRTPLALMLGPLDSLLSSQELSEEARVELERVQRNGQRLLKLVNMLLDFSRIEAGRIQASFEPADLAALTVDLGEHVPFAHGAGGPDARGGLPAARRAGVGGPGDVREGCLEPALQRFQVHLRGRSARRPSAERQECRAVRSRHRHGRGA